MINQNITDKISEKAESKQMKNNLLDMLSQIENGKQPKRIIEKIMDKITTEN